MLPLFSLSLPRKVIQMAEEILYTLVARVVGAQSLRVIPGRPRGTGARRGYARSKASKGQHQGGAIRPKNSRLHRQNVDCDISITHLGGGLDDECTGTKMGEVYLGEYSNNIHKTFGYLLTPSTLVTVKLSKIIL